MCMTILHYSIRISVLLEQPFVGFASVAQLVEVTVREVLGGVVKAVSSYGGRT